MLNQKNIVAAFQGMHVLPQNIAMYDYQESVTTGQTDRRWTDRQTDARQNDPYVPLCFAGYKFYIQTCPSLSMVALICSDPGVIVKALLALTPLDNACLAMLADRLISS